MEFFMYEKIPCGGFRVGEGLSVDGDVLTVSETVSVLSQTGVEQGAFLVMGAEAPEWQVVPNAEGGKF